MKVNKYPQRMLDNWEKNFHQLQAKYGINPQLLHENINHNGNTYKIIGMQKRYQRYPFIVIKLKNNIVYKVPASYIPKQYFNYSSTSPSISTNNQMTVNEHQVVHNKKELEYHLKRLFNSIWKDKEYFDIATPDGRIIATYNKWTNLIRIHPKNVQLIKKSR